MNCDEGRGFHRRIDGLRVHRHGIIPRSSQGPKAIRRLEAGATQDATGLVLIKNE